MQNQLDLDFLEAAQPPQRGNNPADTILEAMGLTGISSIFERMEIAGSEIRNFQSLYPEKHDELEQSFMHLLCPDIMQDKAGRVYRHHVRELLQRVVNEADLEEPTDAEVMCMLSEISLNGPCRQDPAAAYYQLFKQVYPEREIGMELRPSWSGAVEQIIGEIKHKIKGKRHV